MRLRTYSTARPVTLAAAAALVLGVLAAGGPAWAGSEPLGWPQGHQVDEISAPAGEGDGFFGSAVAVSGDGTTAVIGAYYQGAGTGAAYVYQKSGKHWKLTTELTPSDSQSGDYFGSTLAIARDGSTIAVGAWGHDGQQGAAYVFTNSDGIWSQTSELNDPGGVGGDGMGTGLAMTPNASMLVVGANGDDDYHGAAYVYVNKRGAWKPTGKLTASDATEDAGMGGTISISADGSTILTGAYLGGASFQGTAYVFTKSGGTWSQSTELMASDQAPISYFGMQVGLSRSGATAVVSAENHAANQGSAYVFTESGGTWTQAAEVTGDDSVSGDQFGSSASISAKGTTIAVGSISHDDGKGAIYVFSGSGGSWTQKVELTASDGGVADYMGAASQISADGSTIVGGAWGTDSGNGGAYVFKR